MKKYLEATLEMMEKRLDKNKKDLKYWKNDNTNLKNYYEGKIDALKYAIALLKIDIKLF